MERRIVLLGKTGVGKSATGNTILKCFDYSGKYFEVKLSPLSMTKKCKMKEVGRIKVIDTPGIFDTSLSSDKRKKEKDRCIKMSLPGPHAFLLVIKLGRFTEDETTAVKWIQENFSEYVFLYTIVLFTHTDQLGERTLEDFLEESPELRRILNTCGNRYQGFNNKDRSPAQVQSLMEKIDDMVLKNEVKCYTEEMYQEAQRIKKIGEIMGAAASGGTAVAAAAVVGLAAIGAMALIKQ